MFHHQRGGKIDEAREDREINMAAICTYSLVTGTQHVRLCTCYSVEMDFTFSEKKKKCIWLWPVASTRESFWVMLLLVKNRKKMPHCISCIHKLYKSRSCITAEVWTRFFVFTNYFISISWRRTKARNHRRNKKKRQARKIRRRGAAVGETTRRKRRETESQVDVPTIWRWYWKEICRFQHSLPWQQPLTGPPTPRLACNESSALKVR